MNCVKILIAYRFAGCWVFDDAQFGLKAEPFVGDANTVIDKWLWRKCGNPSLVQRTRLMFSTTPFPDHDDVLFLQSNKDAPEHSAFFRSMQFDILCWLCPAMNHYFAEIPNKIYIKIDPM